MLVTSFTLKTDMAAKDASHTYDHIIKYTSLFGGVQGISVLIGVVRNKLLALLLGTAGMGLMSLLNSYLTFISQSTNLGISISAVRDLSAYYDSDDNRKICHFIGVIRIWCLLAGALGFVACLVAGPVLNALSFSWGNHTHHFMLLAPAVAMMAVTGGETAILKATRRLKDLAAIQVVCVVAILLITIPLIYLFNYKAIVPLLVATALVSMGITMAYSYRHFPLTKATFIGIAHQLSEGRGMVKLGIAFVVTGAVASGADMIIRSLLSLNAELDTVGLYNAGYMITITYAGLVFSSMETDYFPRLSAIIHDANAIREVANKQIEVTLLILSPLLCILIFVLPLVIPLLFSNQFLPAVSMAQAATFAMFLKGISLPIAYITLSKGDSRAYMLLESFYGIMLVVCVLVGFHLGGLTGAGFGISSSYLIEIVTNAVYTRVRYKFRLSNNVWLYMAIMYCHGVTAYIIATINMAIPIRIALETVVVVSCITFSISILRRKTSVWSALIKKLKV